MTNLQKQLIVALALGAFVGVAGAQADPMDEGEGSWHREDHGDRDRDRGERAKRTPEQRLKRFSEKLKLTPDQRQQVSTIFEASRTKMEALRAEFRPKFEAIRTDTRAQIRGLLTPDQQKTFDAMNAERDAKRQQRSQRR